MALCLPSSVIDRHCIKKEKRDFLVCSDEYMQVQEPGFLCRYATATRPCMCPDYSLPTNHTTTTIIILAAIGSL
ncbi:unnamed protein product [Triticum turgidum subsp. durum]|uniref:Uncharacterized protein n=1 Tax=Triticum turgidum subsp. durum TaxID=4567 RepID=A0A9R0U540_TRITD|nr:unnamed protein product [Triticum turgidum subsp. durum]